MKILIAGRSKEALETIRGRVTRSVSGSVDTLLLVNGHHDPLQGRARAPHVLVLHADTQIVESLKCLSDRSVAERPALIVVGDHLPTEAMKHAMRAGARDFIAELDSTELDESLRRLGAELSGSGAHDRAHITAVVNAKGGCGASFIATNLACLSAADESDDTLLMDLDFQFAPLARYLDLRPRRSLIDALDQAHELDETAVSAYTSRHASGLDFMASIPRGHHTLSAGAEEGMSLLLDILGRRYDRIVVDVPRHLDAAGVAAVRAADQVLVVLQQSLGAVNDAVRLKSILVEDLGVPRAHIASVINRHSKRAALELRDVREALDETDPALIPNQFQIASESVELGEPACERASGSALIRSIVALQGRLLGRDTTPDKGLLTRLILRG